MALPWRLAAPIATLCGVALAGCGSSSSGLVVKTVSEYGGTPIAGVQVQVEEQPWQTTGSGGEASFTATKAPYVVRVYQPMTFTTLQGVRRQHDKVWQLVGQSANPLVLDVDGSLSQIYKARVSGTVTGRSAAGTQVAVGAPVPFAAAADGSFQLPVVWWEGSTSRNILLRAFESDTSQPPGHYLRFGAASVKVTDETGFLGPGGNVAGARVPLTPVAEGHVSGNVTGAAAATLRSALALQFGKYDWLGLGEGSTSGLPLAFDYALPLVAGATPWIQFTASSGSGFLGTSWHDRAVTPPATGVSFDLPASVSLLEPADSASFSSSTVFRWNAGPAGGKYALDLSCADWNEGPLTRNIHYRAVETTTASVALPAIPGVAIPAGTSCSWSVQWTATIDPLSETRGSQSAARATIASGT